MKQKAKSLRIFLIALTFVIPFGSLMAQKGTNVKKLQELSQRFQQKWEQDNKAAKNFAKRKGIPFKFETEDGTFFELQSVMDSIPMYYITENANSAATISTNNLHTDGSSGLDLDGSGMTIHEWDGGAVLGTHQEYAGRVVMGDGVTTTHYHSTHVAGTLIASGVVSSAKGMAPEANLRAFDWNSDESEMATEAANGALFSNHSYGYGRGWVWTGTAWSWYGNTSISTQEDYLFGFYDSQAQEWDQIAYNAPYYLIVKSAGNDRGDGPSNPPYPIDGPYDCISHAGLGKNVLTVGAVNDIPGGYSVPSDVTMSSFSSWGPADDGRIKPDISTNGVSLYSSYNTNNSSYASLSGTSMAAPSATGSLALLQEHYEDLNGTGNYMLAATLKALVISTADEAGPDEGPDYMFGWGLMNTESAALKISEDQNINVIDELVLNNGGSYTRTVHSDGIEPLKITICWTELPGTPTSNSLDPITSMLVNDLDLKITMGGNTFYPWKLSRNSPSSAATKTGENDVDNVEMVFIGSPAAGDYLITVDHDGTLSNGSQNFSIIYEGISSQNVRKGPYLIYAGNNTEMKVLWQDVQSSTDVIRWGTTTSYSDGSANSTEYGTDHQHAYVVSGLTPGTKYYYQVESMGEFSNGSFMAAADASSTSLKFLAYGDTRSFPNDHDAVAEEIITTYTNEPDYQNLLISMGDLINNGDLEADWENEFFETGLPNINTMLASIPYQSCMGNHEGDGILFQKYFPYDYQTDRYYSYEYGPVLFIALDQYVSYSPGSAQYIWLENLLSNTTKAWKILYFHEPGWTAAGGHENNLAVQDYIQPLCEQYGVHITFAGHNHYYSRAEVTLNGKTVQHITTGGGGAPLRTPDPNQAYIVNTSSSHHFCKINILNDQTMEVEVVDKNGVQIDQFTVNQSNNSDPTVSLTAPSPNTHYESPQSITITADATDSDGSVSQVEFLIDGSPIGSDNSAPYSISWAIPANGAYAITAKATDDLGAWSTSAAVNITAGSYTNTFSLRIGATNDDVEESIAGQMYMTSSDIEMVYDTYNTTGNQTIGLRFANLGIPQGSLINSASIQFTVDEANTGITNLTIQGENIDDSPVFATTPYNVSGRNTTTSSVEWIPPEWSTIGAAGPAQLTPNLSGIVQEIVDRPGFSPTSSVSFIITGTGERTAEAFDGVAGSAALLNIDYTVGSDNSPPVFTSNPVVEANATEDIFYTDISIADNATDPDLGDILSFTKISGPDWLSVATNGGLSGTPLNGDVGMNSWTVEVNDGNGGTSQATLEITVINTNDPPVFLSNPVIESNALEDILYNSTLIDNVDDPDPGDDLTFSKVSFTGPGADWLIIDVDGDLSGTPANENVGIGVWTVEVDDGNGGTNQAELRIEVLNTNDIPVFTSNPVVEADATEDIFYTDISIADNATDPDLGDILSFTKISGPDWLSVATNGGLSGTPLNGDVGMNSWTVEVDDGNEGTSQATLEIMVINANDPPVFISDPIVETNANINVAYSSSISDDASDPDTGDGLTFSKETGPTWLNIANDGSLSGTPIADDVGLNSWSIKVIDGNAGSDQATLEITVIDVSTVEYCESSGNSSSEFIQRIQIGAVSNNSGNNGGYEDFTSVIETLYIEESSTINFTLTPGFNGRSSHQYWAIWIDYDNDGFFTNDDREFASSKSKSSVTGSFIPTGGTGLLRMRISMSDSGTPPGCGTIGGGEVEDYMVQIGAPVVVPPLADFLADQTTIVAGGSVGFTDLSTNGPDTYFWSFPGGLPSTSTEPNPSVTYSSIGDYDVSLTVTNTAGSDGETKTGYITVTAPQDPVADFYASPTAIFEGESVQFTDISLYGPTSWSWDFGDGSPTSSEQNPSHIYANAGTYSVSLSISNGIGSDALTLTDYITVSVQPVSPYCEPIGITNSTWITSINIDGTINNSGKNDFAYTFFTSPEFDLLSGSSYSISLVPNDPKSRNFWRVWIDANGDGDFIDIGETLFTGNNKKGIVNGNITIPPSTVASTRLRITMKTGSSPAPCDGGFNGEVEDYIINSSIGDGKNGFITNNSPTNESTEHSFRVYPNPAAERVTLDFDAWEGEKLIRLIDMTGRTLLFKTIYNSTTEIDVTSYPKGIYLIDVNDGKVRGHRKITIQ